MFEWWQVWLALGVWVVAGTPVLWVLFHYHGKDRDS